MFTLILATVFIFAVVLAIIEEATALKKTNTSKVFCIILFLAFLSIVAGYTVSRLIGFTAQKYYTTSHIVESNPKELIQSNTGDLITNLRIKDKIYTSFTYKDKEDTIDVIWANDNIVTDSKPHLIIRYTDKEDTIKVFWKINRANDSIVTNSKPHLIIKYTVKEFDKTKLPPKFKFFTLYSFESKVDTIKKEYILHLPH